MFVDFEEVRVVHDGLNGVLDVVGLLRIVGYERIERIVAAIDGVGGGAARRVIDVVGRKKAEPAANHGQGVGVIGSDEKRDAAGGVMGHGAAELLLGGFLVGGGLFYIGAGAEHL